MDILYHVVDKGQLQRYRSQNLSKYEVFFVYDSWNDFSYTTMCNVFVFAPDETSAKEVGWSRVCFKGQTEKDFWGLMDFLGQRVTSLRGQQKSYCSLSNDEAYYEEILSFGEEFAYSYFEACCDAIFNYQKWEEFEEEEVFQVSLLRNKAHVMEIRDEFPTWIGNQAAPQDMIFKYTVNLEGAACPHELDFDFEIDDFFPYRINLLTGINGTGKTQVLANLAIALTGYLEGYVIEGYIEDGEGINPTKRGEQLIKAGKFSRHPSFYGCLAISFSAFDEFEIPEEESGAKDLRYTYCGLRSENGKLKKFDDLKAEILLSIQELSPKRGAVLNDQIQNLFGTMFDKSIDLPISYHHWIDSNYSFMSAGQRILLSTLVSLVSNVRRRTVVLLDEPETHLHPMLIATLVRMVHDVLDEFDAYMIIASHSPIVAQQIPSKRIQILGRDGALPYVNSPDIECFGESISHITAALFGAIEGERDYIDHLKQIVDRATPEERNVLLDRSGELGTNARRVLRHLMREKDNA